MSSSDPAANRRRKRSFRRGFRLQPAAPLQPVDRERQRVQPGRLGGRDRFQQDGNIAGPILLPWRGLHRRGKRSQLEPSDFHDGALRNTFDGQRRSFLGGRQGLRQAQGASRQDDGHREQAGPLSSGIPSVQLHCLIHGSSAPESADRFDSAPRASVVGVCQSVARRRPGLNGDDQPE